MDVNCANDGCHEEAKVNTVNGYFYCFPCAESIFNPEEIFPIHPKKPDGRAIEESFRRMVVGTLSDIGCDLQNLKSISISDPKWVQLEVPTRINHLKEKAEERRQKAQKIFRGRRIELGNCQVCLSESGKMMTEGISAYYPGGIEGFLRVSKSCRLGHLTERIEDDLDPSQFD